MEPEILAESFNAAHKRIRAAVEILEQQSKDHAARTRTMTAVSTNDAAVRSVRQLEVVAGFLENTAGIAAPTSAPAPPSAPVRVTTSKKARPAATRTRAKRKG